MRSQRLRVLARAVVFALVIAGSVEPARAADEILSGNIKEADNKSGQSTNTGSGIKTNHIQNSAVTSAKIKDGTVGAADLANSAVTSAKITDGSVAGVDLAQDSVGSAHIVNGSIGPADLSANSVQSSAIENGTIVWEDIAMGAVNSFTIQDGTVFGADIADGAVTDAKIADGSILGYDLAPGAVTSEKIWPGAVTPEKIGFYSHVVIVDAGGGGDFTSPVAAMDAITDASASNPYLVKIMPGVYDVGASSVVMKPHVDIEGSGEGTTLITGQVPSITIDNQPASGLVIGASDAEIRSLTAENSTTAATVCGFFTPAGAAPTLSQVTVRALGGGLGSYKFAIYNAPGSVPTLSRVRAIARGGQQATGIQSTQAIVTMTDVTATASDASMTNSGIINYYYGAATLRRVEAAATGASVGAFGYGNTGISNYLTSATLIDVTATASGSSLSNVAVLNEHAGGYSLTNVVATGYGALSYGMRNRADAGSPGSILATADRCTLGGNTASVLGDGEFATRISASKLAGGAADAGGGELICVWSNNGNYQGLGANCLP